MKKRFVLIDGNSLMFRAYYATSYRGNLMQTSTGLYTNAIYGFYAMTNNILRNEEYTFVAFDAGSQTFRHQEFTDYKATRKPLPDELRMQIPYIKKYLDILNVKRHENLDYEADDILASLATKFYNDFDEIVIISGDKDLLQLVNDKVKVLLPTQGTKELDEYNNDNFYEKLNIYPYQITDYKGLVGDTSDNLPGIKGIGEKTAKKLLSEYKSLENIIENVDRLEGKVKQNILDNYEVGLRCKRLATLKKDIELNYSLDDFKLTPFNYEELINFLKELEFNSFLKDIKEKYTNSNISNTTLVSNLQIITDPNLDLTSKLKDNAYLNIEVFGQNYYTGEFLGISYVDDDNHFFFPKEVVINNKSIIKYLEDESLRKKVADFKIFIVVLKKYNIKFSGVIFDLMIAAYLINPKYGVGDVKQVASNFLENNLPYYENIYGANTKMKIPETNVYAKYSVEKGLLLKQVEEIINKELEKIDVEYLYKLEIELAEVLAQLEYNGLKIDLERLDQIGIELENKLKVLEKEIYEIAGEEFNINSPKQLGEILFDKLHLPLKKKTKTGNYSTNVDVLEKLANDFEICKKVLEYRTVNKLITTYINAIKELVSEEGFIHPLYKQTETQTGRLASIEPNIQNMPIRTEDGQVIRDIFVSRFKDGKILSADYSQIELRVLAHLSGDEEMIKLFNNSYDFHAQTASKLYDVDISMVTSEMRRMAKAINFGIIYGMSVWGLSETINITQLEANIYINKYFDTFKKAKEYLDSLVTSVKTDGYTKTILNRRRYIPEAVSSNATMRQFGERTAMNAPIQGSAADLIKIAMVNLHKRMQAENLKSLMIAQVHDELLFDCPNEEALLMEKIVKEEMEKAYNLKVKLEVGTSIGSSWLEAK